MDYQTIGLHHEAGVAWLTLSRPEKKNALTSRMRVEIRDAVGAAPGVARVLVLTGAGDAFCAGQDLGDAGGLNGADVERILREEYEPMLRAILDCPIPTIAAVNGAAAGAGANLALAADVVIATESAVFLQAFTRIGLIPDAGGTYLLPRQIGLARAMGAALFAEPVPARTAADWGMIWEAVPDDTFQAHVADRAAQLARGPTEAYRHLKDALRQSVQSGFDDQIAREAHLQGQAARTRDFTEGVVAFLENRPPRFEGR